jgi:hypothetical protein
MENPGMPPLPALRWVKEEEFARLRAAVGDGLKYRLAIEIESLRLRYRDLALACKHDTAREDARWFAHLVP